MLLYECSYLLFLGYNVVSNSCTPPLTHPCPLPSVLQLGDKYVTFFFYHFMHQPYTRGIWWRCEYGIVKCLRHSCPFNKKMVSWGNSGFWCSQVTISSNILAEWSCFNYFSRMDYMYIWTKALILWEFSSTNHSAYNYIRTLWGWHGCIPIDPRRTGRLCMDYESAWSDHHMYEL